MEANIEAAPSPPADVERIMHKLALARERYEESAAGQRIDGAAGRSVNAWSLEALSPEHQATIDAALVQYPGSTAIASAVASAVSIGGHLCSQLSGFPTLFPDGSGLDWERNTCEQLLFADVVDLVVELTAKSARDMLERQHALREAERQAERDRIEAERVAHRRRVQAARDARWQHITPIAAAAFRLAAKHPSGVAGEVARAIIAVETSPRNGEAELPDELDALLWRLTADKLTNEERELVGLPRR